MPIDEITTKIVQTVQPYDVRRTEIFPGDSLTAESEQKVISPFKSFFNAAMDAIEETNSFSIIADRQQQDLATGKTNDILGVLLAQDKAYSTLNFTVQVTNKIIESYREIMRMQV